MEQNQAENAAVAHTSHEDEKCDITPIVVSFSPAVPDIIAKEVDHVLHLAAHILKEGGEVPMLFVGMDKDGHGHLIDPEGIPIKRMVNMLVRKMLAQMDAVAAIMISEAWSLPAEVTKAWADGGRPEGMAVKDHPEAFEVLGLSVETLNGTWYASAKVTPYVEGSTVERTVGELAFEKVTATNPGQMLLKQNLPEDFQEHPILEMLGALMGGFQTESMDDGEEEAANGEAKKDDEPDHGTIVVNL